MDFQAVTTGLQKWVAERIVPGFSVALLNGKQVQSKVAGEAQWLPHPEPLRPKMLYDIASLTKVVGTTTVFFAGVGSWAGCADNAVKTAVAGVSTGDHVSAGTDAYIGT